MEKETDMVMKAGPISRPFPTSKLESYAELMKSILAAAFALVSTSEQSKEVLKEGSLEYQRVANSITTILSDSLDKAVQGKGDDEGLDSAIVGRVMVLVMKKATEIIQGGGL